MAVGAEFPVKGPPSQLRRDFRSFHTFAIFPKSPYLLDCASAFADSHAICRFIIRPNFSQKSRSHSISTQHQSISSKDSDSDSDYKSRSMQIQIQIQMKIRSCASSFKLRIVLRCRVCTLLRCNPLNFHRFTLRSKAVVFVCPCSHRVFEWLGSWQRDQAAPASCGGDVGQLGGQLVSVMC